jgi:uncharacterized protein (DUF1778 family)
MPAAKLHSGTQGARTQGAGPRTATINVRAPQQARDLIEQAAEVSGKTLTDFLLDSATERAVKVLLDQRLYRLDPERHAAFMQALDAPPPPKAKLKVLLRKRPLWEN